MALVESEEEGVLREGAALIRNVDMENFACGLDTNVSLGGPVSRIRGNVCFVSQLSAWYDNGMVRGSVPLAGRRLRVVRKRIFQSITRNSRETVAGDSVGTKRGG